MLVKSIDIARYDAQSSITTENTSHGASAVANKIAEWVCDEFERANSVKVGPASVHFWRITEAARKALPVLSTLNEVDIRIDDLMNGLGISVTLTRAILQEKYDPYASSLMTLQGVPSSSRRSPIPCSKYGLSGPPMRYAEFSSWCTHHG